MNTNIEEFVREKILELTKNGMSLSEIARKSYTQQASLWRFVNRPESGLTLKTVNKLWPIITASEAQHDKQN